MKSFSLFNEKQLYTASTPTYTYLKIFAGEASVGPPLGPVIGQFGISAPKFVKEFNERTAIFSEVSPLLKVRLKCFSDKNFEFEIFKPFIGYLLERSSFKAESNVEYMKYMNLLTKDFADLEQRFIKISTILKVARFKFPEITENKKFFILIKNICSTLKSMNIIILK